MSSDRSRDVVYLLRCLETCLDEASSKGGIDPSAVSIFEDTFTAAGAALDELNIKLDALTEKYENLCDGNEPMVVEDDHVVADDGDGECDDGDDCDDPPSLLRSFAGDALKRCRVGPAPTNPVDIPSSQPKPWRDE